MGGSCSDDLKMILLMRFSLKLYFFEVMFLIDILRAILKIFGLFSFSALSVLGDCELHRF